MQGNVQAIVQKLCHLFALGDLFLQAIVSGRFSMAPDISDAPCTNRKSLLARTASCMMFIACTTLNEVLELRILQLIWVKRDQTLCCSTPGMARLI